MRAQGVVAPWLSKHTDPVQQFSTLGFERGVDLSEPLLLLPSSPSPTPLKVLNITFSSRSAVQHFHPMTWLPSIPGLRRRDPEHRYVLGDVSFPVSVTGVLRIQKSAFAMARIEATAEIWQPRGNSTHRALELYLRLCFEPQLESGRLLDRPDVADLVSELADLRSGDYADWITPLLDHDHWRHVDVIASERCTCCLIRRVAGTFDLAYVCPRGRVLADLKSLGPNGSTYCTRAQLGAYMALEATHGHHYDYGQTIWARPGRSTFSPLYTRRECLLAWAAAWASYQAAVAH